MTNFKEVVVLQDEDNHWYIIPIELKDEFIKLSESNSLDDEDEFINKFSEYMTGGSINNIRLYIRDDKL